MRTSQLTWVAIGLTLMTASANAGPIAGVDFESTPGATGIGNFDRTPDDLDATDGITVSADWTLASNGDLRWDNGAQTAPIPPSTITARFQNTGSWSIAIPADVTLNLTGIAFLMRGGTGSTGTPTTRSGAFNTNLDGGPGGTMLWSNAGLISRPTWTPVSVDLSGSTYQSLTDTTVTFYWYALTGGTDIDTIVLSGTTGSSGFALTSVAESGADLVLTWESQAGKLYDVMGTTDPTSDPQTWTPLVSDIASTPPENTETFTKPVDPDTVFMVLEKPLPPIFEDDFEGDLGWTMGVDLGTGTAWARGTPSNVGPAGANSPVNCYATNLDANYGVDADIYLRSPEIDLSTATAATLSFWQFTDIEAGFDYGAVRVLKASDLSQLGTDIVNPVDGVTTEWTEFTAPMPSEAIGENVILEFRFISDDSEVFAGWYVDDVTVTGE